MTSGDPTAYEPLDYAATLAKLTDLEGREVLVELRVGDLHGPFRLAARGVLVGTPPGQAELTGRRSKRTSKRRNWCSQERLRSTGQRARPRPEPWAVWRRAIWGRMPRWRSWRRWESWS